MIKSDFAWHPYLFALFPILYLYAVNAHQVALGEIFLPMLVVMISVAILTTGLNLAVKEIHMSSLIVTVGLIWFFSWGHILEIGAQTILGDPDPLNSKYNVNLTILACLSLGLVSYFLYRSKKPSVRLTRLANKIGLLLVVLQVCTAGWVVLNRSTIAREKNHLSVIAKPETKLPDIYYLIVDGYARTDILADLFDYDNRPFISYLRQRGFYVADQANANYSQTLLSLTSTLNMNLIDQIATLDPSSDDRLSIKDLLDKNQLFEILKANDYQIAVFESGYNMIGFDRADITLRTWYHLSEFGGRLLESTPLPFFAASLTSPYANARNRLDYTFNTLPELGQLQSPCFVFAHILCPHPPFLYDSTGADREPPRSYNFADGTHYVEQGGTKEEYRDGYTQQIKYITHRLTLVIDKILEANKDNPPVILLQADHGSGLQLDWSSIEKTNVRERMGILNAYYLPGLKDSSLLYPWVTPVNSFRILLNAYFDANLPLIPDRSFLSQWDSPLVFQDVTERLSPPN